MYLADNNEYVVLCDFDGTITTEDTVDKLLECYASDEWITIEKLWVEDKISSRECLERQVACIDSFFHHDFDRYIDTLTIDEHFISFLQTVRGHAIDFYIVSDGFAPIIERILKKHGIDDAAIFSNDLIHADNRLTASFPHYRKTCKGQSGICKCSVLQNLWAGRKVIYIGDGKSDTCVAKHADILFAKNKLQRYCEEKGIDYIPYTSFDDIIQECVQGGIFNAENEYAVR